MDKTIIQTEQETEEYLIEEYNALSNAYFSFAQVVGNYFMGKAYNQLRCNRLINSRIVEAEETLRRCPDPTTKAFIADAIRQFKKENPNG